jgi:hypothetical protein
MVFKLDAVYEGVELNFIDRETGCAYMYVRRNSNYLMTNFS